MTNLEMISRETMIFMRGKYRLDEVGDGKDELKFKQGKKTILTVYTHEDRFTFLVIFGKTEREVFEAARGEYSQWMNDQYENANTYHDGKWMFIDVTEPEQLEEVKKLILIKKKPNRKPFPKEGKLMGGCGHRCDLCIHYKGMSEELRAQITPNLEAVWGPNDWSMRCGGCFSDDCHCKDDPCDQKLCVSAKGLAACRQCSEYPCDHATVGDGVTNIHTRQLTADDITWGILPYVPNQYEE